MKATVTEACISCGLCVEICPEVFELPENELARVKADPVPQEAQAKAREAAESCPTSAIEIAE